MAELSERAATSLTEGEKRQLSILAERQDVSESEYLRQLVQDAIEDADIPDEVIEFFEAGGNRDAAAALMK
jgi:hypothetical protein